MTEFAKKIAIHEALVNDLEREHDNKGHVFYRNGFQDSFPNEIQSVLTGERFTEDINAILERGKSDAFVMTKQLNCYHVDAKTLDNYRQPQPCGIPNLSIEVTSYANHYTMAGLGARILIPIRYSEPYNIEKGFWLKKDSRLRYRPKKILVPFQTIGTQKETNHLAMAKTAFDYDNDIDIIKLPKEKSNSDSGDLFTLIDAEMVLRMGDWRDLIP